MRAHPLDDRQPSSVAPARRRDRAAMRARLVLFGLALTCAAAGAQQASPPAPPTSVPETIARIMEASDPRLRAGLRAHVLRESQGVVPVVLLTDSPEAAADAIAAWSPGLRFPVLIDDGRRGTAEDIARFVRAFGPERVVRWSPAPGDAFPEATAARERWITERLSSALGMNPAVPDMGAIATAAREAGVPLGGVVAVDVTRGAPDDAWAAGLALAAGRLQALAFARMGAGLNRAISSEKLAQFEAQLTGVLDGAGVAYGRLGDEADAITLVGDVPSKVNAEGPDVKKGEQLALTDAIGRTDADPTTRWAYAGILPGSAARSMYRAMCGLFLAPSSAWLFDGYPSTGAWHAYDATDAGQRLGEAGFTTTVHDVPRNSVVAWQQAVANGISTDLVLVNSKGNARFFTLAEGNARAGEVPILSRPAAVHLIHSWSLQSPQNRDTVGGRWLDHGAYAYAGSVHEPFLNAFVPTPIVATRLASGAAFGVAVRTDEPRVWKINTLADPLLTFRLPAAAGVRRAADELPLVDSGSLDTELRAALTDGAFDRAVRALVLSGRDADAERLLAALNRDRADAFTAGVASNAAMAMFRQRAWALLAACFSKMPLETVRGTTLEDALWHALPRLSEAAPAAGTHRIASSLLRGGQETQDAATAARAIRRAEGPAEAVTFLESFIASAEARDVRLSDGDRRFLARVRTQLSR
ncbi:MAG: hypothetical protein AAF235_05035, partial [Planctomycetota bacterium]